MIPRYQIIIFSILLLASLAMGGVLWHLRQRAHERLVAGVDSAPTKAPEVAPAEKATLMVANDDDNSLLAQVHSLPLPADPGSRARAVLGRLLEIYARQGCDPSRAGRRGFGFAGVSVAVAGQRPTGPLRTRPARSSSPMTGPPYLADISRESRNCRGQPDQQFCREPSIGAGDRDPHRALDLRNHSRQSAAGDGGPLSGGRAAAALLWPGTPT